MRCIVLLLINNYFIVYKLETEICTRINYLSFGFRGSIAGCIHKHRNKISKHTLIERL